MSTIRAAITSSVFLVGLGGHLMGVTVKVGTCRSGIVTFSTIQSAVNASPAGATVLVCPGAYPEQVVINKALTLRGVQSGTLGAAVIVWLLQAASCRTLPVSRPAIRLPPRSWSPEPRT